MTAVGPNRRDDEAALEAPQPIAHQAHRQRLRDEQQARTPPAPGRRTRRTGLGSLPNPVFTAEAPRALHAHRQPVQPLQARQAAARLEEAAGDRGHLVCRRLAIRRRTSARILRHRLERLRVQAVADERRHLEHAARDLRADGLDRVRIEAEFGTASRSSTASWNPFGTTIKRGRLAALEQPRRLGLVRHLRQLEEVLRGPAGEDLRQGARHERVVLVEEQHRGRRQRCPEPPCARRRRTR